jgi:hypothetical protein
LSYFPIYKAMQAAAGSNVVTASPRRHEVTGAINLTLLTLEGAELKPAKEVLIYSGFTNLIRNPLL